MILLKADGFGSRQSHHGDFLMASTWLTQFSQQYELTCSPTGNIFGKVGGYFVSVLEKGNLIIINFSYYTEPAERQKINRVVLKMRENATISALSGDFSVSINGASIRLPNTEQAQSVVYKLITDYTELFKEIELLAEKKPEPVIPIADPTPSEVIVAEEPEVQKEEELTEHTATFEYNYTNPDFNTDMYGNLMPSAKKKIVPPSSINYTGMASVLRGFAGAVIGAFIGAIPWIICLGLNLVTEILALVSVPIAFCSGMGYRRAHGASDSVATCIAIIISVIGVAVVTMHLFLGNTPTDADYLLAIITGGYSSVGMLMYMLKSN